MKLCDYNLRYKREGNLVKLLYYEYKIIISGNLTRENDLLGYIIGLSLIILRLSLSILLLLGFVIQFILVLQKLNNLHLVNTNTSTNKFNRKCTVSIVTGNAFSLNVEVRCEIC